MRGLTLPAANPHEWTLKDIELAVRKGEVFGIAGIAGSGQSELFAALSGERLAPARDSVAIAGTDCGHIGIDGRRRLGAAFVPEERLGHAAVPTHRLSENALLSHHATGEVARGGVVAPERGGGRRDRAQGRRVADESSRRGWSGTELSEAAPAADTARRSLRP